MPEVVERYNSSDKFDFMLKVMMVNMNAYYDFHVNKLSLEENIRPRAKCFCNGNH